MKSPLSRLLAALTLTSLLASLNVQANTGVLNLYSARHYQTDEALYDNFTKQTGIKINRIDGKEDELFERIRQEGRNSPADVFLTVDAARLYLVDQAGLFEPVKSKILSQRIPAQFRDPEGVWYAFSYRARTIVYNKDKVNPADIQSYEDLAAPRFKGKICTRSSGHPYMRTLLAGLIHNIGEKKAEAWAKGVAANLARAPKGGDTDQIRAVAAGECDIALSNSYYLVRLMRSDKPEDKEVVAKVGNISPNQKSYGTHVNVSGGGMLKTAPNKAAAVKFLEYLASDDAQRYFANGNNEYAVVKGVKLDNPTLESLGKFKVDSLDASILAKYGPKAQMIYDRVGYK